MKTLCWASLALMGALLCACTSSNGETVKPGAWVVSWKEKTEKLMEEYGGKCDEEAQNAVYQQVHTMVLRVTADTPYASQESLAAFGNAVRFSQEIIKKEIRACGDHGRQWQGLARTLTPLLSYIHSKMDSSNDLV